MKWISLVAFSFYSHLAATAELKSLDDFSQQFAQSHTVDQVIQMVKPAMTPQQFNEYTELLKAEREQGVRIERTGEGPAFRISSGKVTTTFAAVDIKNRKYAVNQREFIFDRSMPIIEAVAKIEKLLPQSSSAFWPNLLLERADAAAILLYAAGAALLTAAVALGGTHMMDSTTLCITYLSNGLSKCRFSGSDKNSFVEEVGQLRSAADMMISKGGSVCPEKYAQLNQCVLKKWNDLNYSERDEKVVAAVRTLRELQKNSRLPNTPRSVTAP